MGNARREFEVQERRDTRAAQQRTEGRGRAREEYRDTAPSRETVKLGAPGDRLVGKITKIVREKGFGFIRTKDNKEFFFHRSQAEEFDVFDEGEVVTFEPNDGPKGLRAQAVTYPAMASKE